MDAKNDYVEVTKCLQRKDGIKYAIIPKKSKIEKADPIMIIKLDGEKIRSGK